MRHICRTYLQIEDVLLRDRTKRQHQTHPTCRTYPQIAAVRIRVSSNGSFQIYATRHIHRTSPQIAAVSLRVISIHKRQIRPTCRIYPQIRDLCLIFQPNRAQTLLPYPQIAVVFLRDRSNRRHQIYSTRHIHRTYPQIAAVSLRVSSIHKRQILTTSRICLQIVVVFLRVSSISMR